MAELVGRSFLREASIEAVVLRCTCGSPSTHADRVCPLAVAVPYGVVSYYHRNPLRRWLWRASRRLGRT